MKSTRYIPTVLSLNHSLQENIRDTVQDTSLTPYFGDFFCGASGGALGRTRGSLWGVSSKAIYVFFVNLYKILTRRVAQIILKFLRYMISQVMKNNIM